ncbi:SAM-dependent methyltransferase [uncultured Shewanella sp.]|uniref:SAM-dependent methyltransferase n=1 Tax=uncultured Shewanella sp. TaxID=173975 RepID=UPI00261C9AED|nr:SAM-dependent methyltransferase [uncultured Shewanella sp.]
MTNSLYVCPKCKSSLHLHAESQGLYCDNKHHFDKDEKGYWVLSRAKKPKMDSRQVMRAKRHLLASGLFTPLVDAMAALLIDSQNEIGILQQSVLTHLDFDCADGFYMRALANTLEAQAPSFKLVQTGIAEAENALFAAAKSAPDNTYIVSQLKVLPFVNHCFDLVTLIDRPLKGKELFRVLKKNGIFLQVIPSPRHLWQIKTLIYTDLANKELDLSVPSEMALIKSQPVSFTVACSGEQALTLLDMTPFAWRASDKIRKQIASMHFDAIEIDFVVALMVKK